MSVRIVISLLMFAALLPVGYQQASGLEVAYTQKEITADPISDVWNEATSFTINLGPQQVTEPHGGKNLPGVVIRGVHNGRFIGFLMEWADQTKDTKVTGDGFRDGAALQFPLSTEALPSPFMGSPEIVNIWFWRADWQADLEGADYFDAEYPNYVGYNFPQDEQLFQKEIRGGRLIGTSPVEDMVAQGFGTLERQEQQDVAGKGVYSGGKWKVAFIRPMVTNDAFDTQFISGMATKINFAVWDGSNKNRDGQKSVSIVWTDLRIGEVRTLPRWVGIAALLTGIVLGALGFWAVRRRPAAG